MREEKYKFASIDVILLKYSYLFKYVLSERMTDLRDFLSSGYARVDNDSQLEARATTSREARKFSELVTSLVGALIFG